MTEEQEAVRHKIEQMLKDRRLNYRDFENVSDGTCLALSYWLMDVVSPAITNK